MGMIRDKINRIDEEIKNIYETKEGSRRLANLLVLKTNIEFQLREFESYEATNFLSFDYLNDKAKKLDIYKCPECGSRRLFTGNEDRTYATMEILICGRCSHILNEETIEYFL